MWNPQSGHTAHRTPHSACHKGQAVIEYAVLLTIVVAALVAMQIYIKRGMAGLLRGAADGMGGQFDPKNTTGTLTSTSTDNTTTTAQTLNEPDLTNLLKDTCRAEGKPPQECDAICIDLNENGTCSDPRVFGEIVETILNAATTTTNGTVTVGPLGTDLWAR